MEDSYFQTVTFSPVPSGLEILTPTLTFSLKDKNIFQGLQIRGNVGVYYIPYTITNNKNSKQISGLLGPINIIDPSNPTPITQATIPTPSIITVPTPTPRVIPDTSLKPVSNKIYSQICDFGPAPEGLDILTPHITFTESDENILHKLQVRGIVGTYFVPYKITNTKNNKIINGVVGPINIVDPAIQTPIIQAVPSIPTVINTPTPTPRVIPDTSLKPVANKTYIQTIEFGPAPTGLEILTQSLTFTKSDENILHKLQVRGIAGTYFVPYKITNNKNSKIVTGVVGPINIIAQTNINIGVGYGIIGSTFVIG